MIVVAWVSEWVSAWLTGRVTNFMIHFSSVSYLGTGLIKFFAFYGFLRLLAWLKDHDTVHYAEADDF